MTREELLETLHRVLKTETQLDFLLKLTKPEFETLVACIRDRIDHNNS